MGQIVFNNQKPKYCNLQAIQVGGQHVNDSVALNEIWLVDTTNSTKTVTGTGEYDAYIVGDGSHKAGQLELHYLGTAIDISQYSTTTQMQAAINQAITNANIPRNLSQLTEDTNHQTVSQTEKDLWTAGGSGDITNNVDNEDLISVEVMEGVNVIKFNDKPYNTSIYSGLGKKYLRKNIQSTVDVITDVVPLSDLTYKACYYTNQGVGNTCPMELITSASGIAAFNCFKTNVKAGDTWIIKGQGGNTPRLWALIDKTTNKIIAAADANANSLSEPVTLNIENGCILIVNSQSNPADITYRTTADTSSEKNLLTTAMMSSTNTRYVIQYDYDLGGQTLELPQGCVLVFEGGSIKNGMIVGNGASIVAAENDKIFDLTITLSGIWHTQDFYPEWFGAKGDMTNDDTAYIQKVFNLSMTKTASSQIGIVCHLNNRYRVTDTLLINDDIHITGKSNVSFNKKSNTNGTILADFGDDWLKWVITTNNVHNTTRELLPYNARFNQNTNYQFKGGGVKIDGINIRVIGNAYGGIRLGGLTDSTIDNVSIYGVYVGINRCSNWYSADSHLQIHAYLCGYASSAENNGHSLSNSYINTIGINKGTDGVIWSKLVFTEETTLYDVNDNEIVLNEGDTITLSSKSFVYINDSETATRLKKDLEFTANWYDENSSTEGNPVYVPVTCYVEYNSSNPNDYEQWVLIPWWNYEKKYIAPKWQYRKELLLTGMPTAGYNTPSKYIFANKNIGYYQSYGNSVLSNVVMEVWNTGVFVSGNGILVDIAPYREAIDGVLYVGESDAKINVNGATRGAFGNVDGHHRFHAIVQGTSRILLSTNSFSEIDVVPSAANSAKVVYENPVIDGIALGGTVIRDRKESEYVVTIGDKDSTEFSRTINSAMESLWEAISIPENYTAIFNGGIISNDKYIRGENKSTSILNINASTRFYGENLVFRNLTVNINAPINGDTISGNPTIYYNLIYNKNITFIGCNITVNGTSIVSYGNYNVNLSVVGTQNERTTLTLKDSSSANSYISSYHRPGLYINDTQNLRLFIKHDYVTTSVINANNDPVTITDGETTRNATVYDRIYAVSNTSANNSRNSNLQLLNKLNCGVTENRPTLTPNIKGFEYFDCTLGKPVWWNGSEWVTWSGGVNYETKTEIVSYSTAPATITAQDNKYYRIDAAVNTLGITLPEITDTTTTHTIVFSFSTGITPNVTFASANNSTISYFDGYEIEVGTTYELIAVFNGLKWIISYGVVA